LQSGVEKLQAWPEIEPTTLDLVSQSLVTDLSLENTFSTVITQPKNKLILFGKKGENECLIAA